MATGPSVKVSLDRKVKPGSSLCKIKNFSRTSERLSYCFQGQVYESYIAKILLHECLVEIRKILEN